MESQVRSVVCPVVYEEGMFVYIGGMVADVADVNGYAFYAFMAVVIAAAVLYFYKGSNKGKYQPLLDQSSAYGSTV